MKTSLFLILSFCTVLTTSAQSNTCVPPHESVPHNEVQHHKPEKRQQFSPEEYRRQCRCFIAKECNLTEKEKALLFPLLDEMWDKQRDVRMKQHELFRNFDNLSEKDYEKIIDKVTDLDVQDKKIEQTYLKKFHSAISWKKVCRLRRALRLYQMEALRNFSPRGRK